MTPPDQPGAPAVSLPAFEAKEMEPFRKADEVLAARAGAVSVLRLSLLLLLIVLFGSEIKRQNDDVTHALVTQISVMQNRYNTAPLDPLGLYTSSFFDSLIGMSGITPKAGPVQTADYAATDADEKKLEGLVASLAERYRQTYLTKISFLGTDLSFDLRTLIVTLPFWLALFHIYKYVVQEKRRILAALAAATMQNAGSSAPVLDRLNFAQPGGAFVLLPDVLAERLFWVLVFALAGFILMILYPSHQLTINVLVLTGQVFFMILFYSFAYASFTADRMRREAEEMFGVAIREDPFIRFWGLAASRVKIWRHRLPAAPALTTCAVFVFLTLFLNTAQVGCLRQIEIDAARNREQAALPAMQIQVTIKAPQNEYIRDPRPGYRMLTGEADWPPSVPLELFDYVKEDSLGRAVYITLLGVSCAALALGLSSRLRKLLPPSLLWLLRSVTLIISTFLICELTGTSLFPLSLWALPFVAALITLILTVIFRHRSTRVASLRRGLVAGLLPLVTADLISLIQIRRALFGFVLLYISAHGLTVAFAMLRGEREPGAAALIGEDLPP